MQLTPDDLYPFLSDQLKAAITGLAPAGQGAWSQTFFFTAGGQRKVIRFSPFAEDFEKDRFAARYASPHLPIPPVEATGAAFGLSFAISPHVDGKLIDHFNEAEMRAAVPALMDLLLALHAVDGAETRGYGGFGADGNATLPSWQAYLATIPDDAPGSRLRGWSANLAGEAGAAAVYRQGRQRLLELVPFCPEERHLVHNDLLHFNLIMRHNRVAAVIDWGCALWGDFLYDLAMFTTWQFYFPALAGIDFAGAARRSFQAQAIPLPHYTERLQCYQIHLLLDSLVYNAWKEDRANLDITTRRLEEVLAGPGPAG